MEFRTITVPHQGTTYYGTIMKINSTKLGYEDHGIFTFGLDCRGGGSGVTIGNMGLDTNLKNAPAGTPDLGRKEYARYGTAYGLDVLITVLNTLGVRSWEDAKGQSIIVLHKNKHMWGGIPVGFAHLLDEDKIMIFEDHAESWKDASDANDD